MRDDDLALLAAELSNVRAQVAELLAERDERRRRRLLRDDPPFLARLLPQVSGCFGSEEFLIRHLAEDPRLATILHGHNARCLGKLFARAVSVPIGMYVVVDCGRNDREGVRRYRVDGV